ncbi:MAG: hypothetical protein IJ217_03315 [Clostridia bacterium]|nr:hypothetical protein [Clostridia bacterium]
MFFIDEMKKIIREKDIQNLGIFVDMDGVIADYRFGEGKNILNNVSGVYRDKRPIGATIEVLKELNREIKCRMHILSSCYHSEQIKEKNDWLNEYASFFELENRIIVMSNTFENRKKLKIDRMIEMMQKFNYDYVVLIDDTHDILFLAIETLHEKVIPFHVITLLD